MIERPKILIIDDIKDNISTLKALIKKTFPDAIVLSAVSGNKGIELAQSTIPDIILLDILMPIKDGFQVCKEIKNTKSINDIPIVFITALKEAQDVKIKAINAGADGFLSKPIEEATLIALINSMLKVREAELNKKNEKERLRLLVKEKTHSLLKELKNREKIEDKLRTSEERYRGLIRNLDSGVVIHDSKTIITDFNDRALDLLGLTSYQMIGKDALDPYWQFISEEEYPLDIKYYPVNIIVSTLKPLKNYKLGIIKGKDTPVVWVNVNGYPRFDESGDLKEVVISFSDITAIVNHEKNLRFLANNDYLTKIYNRRYFENSLRLLNEQDKVPISIAIADINGLKLMNDAFGHTYGDELLKEATRVINEVAGKDDIVARIGGDEFGIIMTKSDSIEAEKKVKRIHKLASEVYIQSIQLSIAIGHHTKVTKGIDLFTVSRTAEDIMYRQKIAEIPSMRSNAIETILTTLYEKDEYSEMHSRSVSNLATNLARANGENEQTINIIKTAGLLHDIGKIIIPSTIIEKKGSLDEDELDVIRTHPEIGFRILNSSSQLRDISDIVLNHHEKFDGSGYPRGVKGKDIPIESRIISICDAFDAMTSERSYREAYTIEKAKEEIFNNAGSQFDPDLAKVFLENLDEIVSQIQYERK